MITPVWRDPDDWAYFVRRQIALHLRTLIETSAAEIKLDLEKLSAWIDEEDVVWASPSVTDEAAADEFRDGIAAFADAIVKRAVASSSPEGPVLADADEPSPATGKTRLRRKTMDPAVVGEIRLPQPGESLPTLSRSVYDVRYKRKQDELTAARLWVEGPTDKAILEIGSRHFTERSGSDLLDGFDVVPAGDGREGGTSALARRLRDAEICRDWDIVLVDDDPEGRKLANDLGRLDIKHVIIPRDIIPSYLDSNVEIEDLIPLGTRDRFYMDNGSRRPEREILYYSPVADRPDARRIVVSGPDKDAFVDWLRAESVYADLEGIINLLHEMRKRFGLPALSGAPLNRQDWLPQLRDRNLVGLRRQPWLDYALRENHATPDTEHGPRAAEPQATR